MDKKEEIQVFLKAEFNKKKQFILYPFVLLLKKTKISPDVLSYLQIIFVILSFRYLEKDQVWGMIFIIIAIILDNLDGAYARFINSADEKGRFIDTFCDFISFIIILFGVTFYGLITPLLSLYYGMILSLSFTLSTLYHSSKRTEKNKNKWKISIKTGTPSAVCRIGTLLSYLFYTITNINVLSQSAEIFSIILTLSVPYHYYKILKNY